MKNDNTQLIIDLKKHIAEWVSNIGAANQLIEVLGGESYKVNIDITQLPKTAPQAVVKKVPPRRTLNPPVELTTRKGWLKGLLASDHVPRTTKQLFNEFVATTGATTTFVTFSGNISQQLKAKNTDIKRHEFPNNPNSSRFYIGLKDWFDGDKLKEEYLGNIR